MGKTKYNDHYYNGSGCPDPTAGTAIEHLEHEEKQKCKKQPTQKKRGHPNGQKLER